MLDVFQTDRFKQSLNTLSQTTGKLAGIMKNDARLRARDYQRISENNRRLRRVIPIIPGVLGTAGYIFGLPDPSEGFGLPGFPGFGLPPLPPRPPGPPGSQPPGPGAPGPQPQPVPDIDIIKEEVEEPTVVDVEDPLDERSPEYNRRKQEEAKRKREQERIQEGVPANVPATPGQKPDEMEEEAKPERKETEVVPTTPPFVPTPPQVPAEPKFDPQKILEGLEAIYGPAPPFVIPDRVTQTGQPMALPRVDIPNFDPNNPKQRRDLDQKIFTYIFKNPSSRFAKKMETGVVLPDGTMIIRRPGQQIMYSEPLTQEQLNLIRLMGVANLSEWLPVVPIRGMGPRRGNVPGTSRPNRPLKPDIEKARQQLEQSFQQPSVPGAQPTQPALPGASINQPRIPAGTRAKGVAGPLETTGPTVDVTPTQSSTTRSRGIIEQIFNPSGRPTRVKQFSDAYKEYSNEQLYMMIRKATDSRTRSEYQRILDKRIQTTVSNDAGAVQGPVPGPQASAIIQPIIVFRDPPTA